MKRILSFFIVLILSLAAFANENDELFEEVIYNINAKQTKNQDNVQELLKTLIKEVKRNPDSPIQINIFQNAYFSNDSKKTKPSRKLASTNKNSYSGIINDVDNKERVHLQTRAFFTRLRARDINNGGSATTNSNQNWGLFLGYDRRLNDDFEILANFHSTFQQYNAPGGTTLTNSRNLYVGGLAGVRWNMDKYFNADMGFGVKQLPYLTAAGTESSISRVTHPYLRGAMELKMESYLGIDLRPQLSAEFLSSGFDGGLAGATGFKFGSKLSYHFKFKKLQPNISVWYDQYSQETRITEQATNELGIWLGFFLWL